MSRRKKFCESQYLDLSLSLFIYLFIYIYTPVKSKIINIYDTLPVKTERFKLIPTQDAGFDNKDKKGLSRPIPNIYETGKFQPMYVITRDFEIFILLSSRLELWYDSPDGTHTVAG